MTRRFNLGPLAATPPDVREALPPRVPPEAAAFAAGAAGIVAGASA